MEESEIIRLLRENRPETVYEIARLGIRLRFLSEGLFRYVYTVIGHKLVIKVPKPEGDCGYEENVDHSRKELDIVSSIQKRKKYAVLRRYLPDILYSDRKTGIILMRKYPKWRYAKWLILDILGGLIEDLFGTSDHDLHYANLGDDQGNPVFIDLGYFAGID